MFFPHNYYKPLKSTTMKRLIVTCFAALIFLGCIGQRYEIWPYSAQSNNTVRGNFVFSNDSVLVMFTDRKWFIPSRDIHFAWEDVMRLQIRNRSRNEVGMYIGAAAGGLATCMHYLSLKNSKEVKGPVEGMTFLFTAPLYPMIGMLAGHLATSKKTEIHMQGMSPKEKNQQLKSKMKRKDK
jgi:hypothetical protein